MSPRRVRLAAESFNSIFRVTTASAVYALRVGAAPQIHPESTAAVEAAGLDGYVASHAERARAWMRRPTGLEP